MSKTYRSAQGRPVNLDAIIVLNEDEIALGNMNVNARGDELGPGGKVVRTRNQIMEEYYKLSTPVAIETEAVADNAARYADQVMAAQAAAQAEYERETNEDPYADLEYVPQAQPNAEDVVADEPVRSPTIQQRAQRSAPVADPTLQGTTRILEDERRAAAIAAESVAPFVAGPKPAVKPPAGPSDGTALRGSLADAVAKTVTVNQTVPVPPNKAGGVKRI